MYKQLVIIISLLLFLSGTAFSLQVEEKFESWDGTRYASGINPWVSQGATHAYLPTGGWNGSGAAKFTPPTGGQGYSGLSNLGSLNARRVNIRFLYYIGSTHNNLSDNNKWLILLRSPYSDGTRVMVLEHPYTSGPPSRMNVGVCANTACDYSIFNLYDYKEQWICFEFESNLDAGLTKVYVSTQDLVYSGTMIKSYDISSPGTGIWDYIQILGGFYNAPISDPNAYSKYDELLVSTEGYIGPPPGFLGTAQRPAAPQGLRIVN